MFFILLTGFCIIFTVFYMIFTGNSIEPFKDFIVEFTSFSGSNKSAEVFLTYFLCFLGIGAYSLYFFLKKRKFIEQAYQSPINKPLITLAVVSFITIFQQLYALKFNIFMFSILIFSLILYKINKEKLLEGLLFYIFNLYTFYSFYRLYAYFGGNGELYYVICSITAFIIALIPFKLKNAKLLAKFLLIEQLFIPFSLLVYIADKYRFNNEIIIINQLPQIKIFIYSVIFIMLIEAIYLIKKNWSKETNLNKILSIGSCISVMGFNVCYYIGNIVPSDLHHPFENIIGYHQIFQMGQFPFKEYIPISGLYSVFHGAIFQFFGNGELSQYYNSENILFLIISIITVVLLSKHTNRTVLFYISFLFYYMHPSVYGDRAIFILPILLLLSLPKIVENANLWLKIWVLTSLFHGLYYPVFGASLCLGFLPLTVYQLKTLRTLPPTLPAGEGESFRYFYRNIVNWLICLIPVLLSIPLLTGTYKHIKAMGSQTIWADGLARFAQGSNFPFSLTSNGVLESVIFYILTFIIPALFVWIAFILALKLFKSSIRNGCMALSLVVFPLIAYSYTILRLDVGMLYARSTGVLIAGAFMLVITALNYLKNDSDKAKFICFALFIPILTCSWGFYKNLYKLTPYYKVPYNFSFVKNDTRFKLGTGFVSHKFLYSLLSSEIKNKEYNYFGLPFFGYYYIYDLKGVSVMEMLSVKGYSATKETIENAIRNNAVFSPAYLDSLHYYYIYNWIMTSGKYVWDTDKKIFQPNNGKYTKEQIKEIHNKLNITKNNLDTGKNPNSFGLTMKTLAHIFSKVSIDFTQNIQSKILIINFDTPLNGNDADFLYIEFSNLQKLPYYFLWDKSGFKKIENPIGIEKYFLHKSYNKNVRVKIEWEDEQEQKCSLFANIGEGKLLLPLGSGSKWLLNNHNYITISVLDNNEIIDIPDIQTIEFLKLREVK